MGTTYYAPVTTYPNGRTGSPQVEWSSFSVMSKSAVRTTAEHAQRKTNPHVFMPPTPFSASEELAVAARTYFQSLGVLAGNDIKHINRVVIPNDGSGLRNRALIKARQDLKDMKVNYAQAFAERQQTANLVAGTAKKLAKAFNALKDLRNPRRLERALAHLGKHKKKALKDTGQAASELWLELQYGWKPLLSDVYGSMVTLHENDAGAPDRYRITARGSARDKYSGYKAATGGINEHYAWTADHSCQVRLDYKLRLPAVQAGTATQGNPLELAWELLPFSFVADWFIPIGGYLSSLDAGLAMDYLGGSSTLRWDCSQTDGWFNRDGWSDTWQKYPNAYWFGRGASRKYKSVNRIVYASSPMPRFPGFKNPFSATHAANAIALLWSSFHVR